MSTSKRTPRRIVVLVAAVAAVTLGALAWIGPRSAARSENAAARVARGEYLVMVGGCNDCHTPWVMGPNGPGPDPTRTLSGHPADFHLEAQTPAGEGWAIAMAATNTAFSGPWGVSFAANLTPDELTGIGVWSEEIFINTLRTGRHWGQSRPILPPMPWFNYGKMTEDDLKAIYAYLRTLPPIHNDVPLPLPPAGTEIAEADWN